MHFLNEISHILALGSIDPTGSFLEKVRPGETVVGTCNRDIQVLLTFMHTLKEKKDDWDAAITATDMEKDNNTFIEYRGKRWMLEQKIKMISACIDTELHTLFPELLSRDVVRIREGWQIVWSNTEVMPKVLPLLVSAIKSLSTPRPSSLAGKN